MIGKKLPDLIPADVRSENASLMARARAGEAVAEHESFRLRKDGKGIFIAQTISPIPSARKERSPT